MGGTGSPLVSVLMPTYNFAEFLPQAIEGVLAQTMGALELIIGHTPSSDNTETIVAHYQRRDSRIVYFRNAAYIPAVENFNRCYKRMHPQSRYWIMCGSDDRWDPTLLEKLVAALEAHPEVTIAHCNGYRVDARGRVINRYSDLYRETTPSPGVHRNVRELFFANYILAFGALVHRERMARLYDPEVVFDPTLTMTPEYALWLRLFLRGAYGYYLPEPLVYYRKHPKAHVIQANVIPRLQQEVRIFREKLEGFCPPELEPLRREALGVRLAHLGFELLVAGRAREAARVLEEACACDTRGRLDIRVAWRIARLPFPERVRSFFWRTALLGARVLHRV